MRENTRSKREVVGGSFQAVGAATRGVYGELGVERGEVVENIHELELEIIAHKRSVGVVSQRRVPGELGANLGRIDWGQQPQLWPT